MNKDKYESLLKEGTIQKQVFDVLSDKKWHCRVCAQKEINTRQYAGGGGIQGLQKGTKSRPGLVIESKNEYCDKCQEKTTWDRWTGEFTASSSAAGLPQKLQQRVFEHYGYVDSIEQRERTSSELVIDHRFPMERWGKAEDTNPSNMSDEEIERKFQLLKKDFSGNHNLLKSRACEDCIKTGKRGFPLGIKFYYAGDENWPSDCPKIGPEAEQGCYGCGWYDFNRWRDALNQFIQNRKGK